MCGRYTLSNINLKKRFSTTNTLSNFDESFNITPGSFVPTITKNSPNRITMMRWGFVPEWSKDGKFNLINIRDDTLKTKSYFSNIMLKQRCLICADGFYEWKKEKTDKGTTKTPYFIFLKNRPIFGFAGIYNERNDAEGKEIFTFAVITCKPNFLVKDIHNRMPVILDRKDEERWLDNKNSAIDPLLKLLTAYPPAKMDTYHVSSAVNNPLNNGSELINPINS